MSRFIPKQQEILALLDAHELDLGVLCAPERLPRGLRVTHRFQDAFTLIAPSSLAGSFDALPKTGSSRLSWLREQNWLLLDTATNTGRQLRQWMDKQSVAVEPTMQSDSFDLIINLVALGMGVSFVPIRALALYGRKRNLTRLALPKRFVRELVVVVRQQRNPPAHVSAFVENVLF